MASTFPKLPIFEAIASHDPASLAIVHSKSNRTFSYGQLLSDVEGAKIQLYHRLKESLADGEPIGGQRVAFLIENGYDYVVTLLAIFACDSIAVPLVSSHPTSELRYIIINSEPATVLTSQKFQEQTKEVLAAEIEKKPTLNIVEKILEGAEHDAVQLIELPFTKGGLMLYTSGTTSRPKGVVLNTSVLTAQAQSLKTAWNYSPSDHLLHVLPLHHIHGTVNCVLTPLFSGSTIEFLSPFNPTSVWTRLASPFLPQARPQSPAQLAAHPSRSTSPQPQHPQPSITFLSAVPTIYTRLLSTFPSLSSSIQSAARTAISPPNLRLNISGSAALPTPTKNAWSDLSSNNILLERYGMTEVGMALSCGLDFATRIDGSVGWPLPSVQVRLVDTETLTVIPIGQEKTPERKEREGEIQLRGPTIFDGYWRNDEATASEFVDDDDGKGKWFKTGDIATRRVPPSPPPIPLNGIIAPSEQLSTQDWVHGPAYFILGRKSTDIIKTGGEKVSALEIERELLALPQVAEAAVVGLPSEQWGQKVCAVVVLEEGWEGKGKGSPGGHSSGEEGDHDARGEVKKWSVLDMRRALKGRLAAVKVPQEMRVVKTIRRNAMGKVNKKELVSELTGE